MKKFLHFFTRKEKARQKQVNDSWVLCSISGGQDSNLAFFVFCYLKQEFFFKTVSCHHFWQRKNFAACLFTFRLSFSFDVPYLLIFPNNCLLTENCSRGWRKKNFSRICSMEKISFLGTGHTQTDNLEKNLHNIFRGVTSGSLYNQNFLNYKKTSISYFSPLIFNFKDYFNGFNNKNRIFVKNFSNQFYSETFSFGYCFSFFPSKKWSQELVSKKNFQITNRKTFHFFKTKKNTKTSLFFYFRTVQTNINKIEKLDYDSFLLLQLWFVKQNTIFYKKCSFREQKNINSFSFCFYSKYFQSKVNLLQPLKSTQRSTVSKLMNFYDFPVLTDLTNFSYEFSRNKIRHQVIPFMKICFHKKIDSLLTNFFKTAEKDNDENKKQLLKLTFIFKLFDLLLLKNLMPDFFFFLFIFKNSKPNIYSPILHQNISDYLEIEITFSQTRKIQNQLNNVKNRKDKKMFQN